jgi:hypothetical protein
MTHAKFSMTKLLNPEVRDLNVLLRQQDFSKKAAWD